MLKMTNLTSKKDGKTIKSKKIPVQTSIPIPAQDVPGFAASTRHEDEIFIQRRVKTMIIEEKEKRKSITRNNNNNQ